MNLLFHHLAFPFLTLSSTLAHPIRNKALIECSTYQSHGQGLALTQKIPRRQRFWEREFQHPGLGLLNASYSNKSYTFVACHALRGTKGVKWAEGDL